MASLVVPRTFAAELANLVPPWGGETIAAAEAFD
jgi:hypothetical protein